VKRHERDLVNNFFFPFFESVHFSATGNGPPVNWEKTAEQLALLRQQQRGGFAMRNEYFLNSTFYKN
jgi:hypothetical protein